MAMIGNLRRLILPMTRRAEAVICILLLMVDDSFGRRPRPSSAPLVSGIAPGDGGSARLLSETQLRELDAWLRLHQEGWRRLITPLLNPSYMVQVEHSDTTTTLVSLFLRASSGIRFQKFKAGRFDSGWLQLPAMEVDRLITLLKEEA
jgi:hypothetical protein